MKATFYASSALAAALAFAAPLAAQEQSQGAGAGASPGAGTEILPGASDTQDRTAVETGRMQPLFTETGTGTADGPGEAGMESDHVVLGSSLIGQPVYNLNGVDEVGQVSDLLIGSDGNFLAFVLGVGGREVTVDRGEIAWAEFRPGERVLAMNAAADRIGNLPDFNREQVLSQNPLSNGEATTAANAQGGQTGTGSGPAPHAPEVDGAAASAVPVQPGATGSAQEPDQAGSRSGGGVTIAQGGADTTGAEMAQGGGATQNTAPGGENLGQGVSGADRQLLRGADNSTDGSRPVGAAPQTLDGVAVSGDNRPQQLQGGTSVEGGDQQQATAGAASGATGEAASTGAPVAAENLMGMTVFGPDDTDIGEVTEVVTGEAGAVEALVIDTGGFLGIGTHTVAVAFDSVDFVEDAGTRALRVSFTEEQLRNQPSWDPEAWRQGEDGSVLR